MTSTILDLAKAAIESRNRSWTTGDSPVVWQNGQTTIFLYVKGKTLDIMLAARIGAKTETMPVGYYDPRNGWIMDFDMDRYLRWQDKVRKLRTTTSKAIPQPA